MKKLILRILPFLIFSIFTVFAVNAQSFPQGSTQGTTTMTEKVTPVDMPLVDLSIRNPQNGQEVAFSVQVLLLLTILSLAPSILILLTCFLRFSIVLDFIKRALSLQQVPPTIVLNGIALFMTLFIMLPTFNQIYTNSFKPLADGEIGVEQAYTNAINPMRNFMFSQIPDGNKSLDMFLQLANIRPETLEDIPT